MRPNPKIMLPRQRTVRNKLDTLVSAWFRLVPHVDWLQLSDFVLLTPPPHLKLYETTLVRHGIMLVGPTGGGKTKIFRCLRTALDKTMGITHKDSRFNPKAIRAQEMYGEVDPSTGEWNTGIIFLYFALNTHVRFPRPPYPETVSMGWGSAHRCAKKSEETVAGRSISFEGVCVWRLSGHG